MKQKIDNKPILEGGQMRKRNEWLEEGVTDCGEEERCPLYGQLEKKSKFLDGGLAWVVRIPCI